MDLYNEDDKIYINQDIWMLEVDSSKGVLSLYTFRLNRRVC